MRYPTGPEFDAYVARYYTNKINDAKTRNIPFSLTFTQVKNMLRAKKCQLTGIDLTHTGALNGIATQRLTDVTIDRIDNSKGYEKGNVLAASHMANQIKNGFEMKCGKRAIITIHTMSKALKKRGFE